MTAPDRKEAVQLARGLLERKLAACVNVVGGVESHYWWEGRIQEAKEVLLLAKTRSGLVADLTAFVRANHSYAVPEVLALEVAEGNPGYLDWVGANTLFVQAQEEGEKNPL